MLEKLPIKDEEIIAYLQENYGLSTLSLDFLPSGFNTSAWAYRVLSENNKLHFLKAWSGLLYEPPYLVPRALKEQGIENVVAPLPTKQGQLWTHLGELVFILYPFIEGASDWASGLTGRQWQKVGATFKQIHSVTLPPELLAKMRQETFDAAECRWIKEFDGRLSEIEGKNEFERHIISSWTANRPTLRNILAQMENLAVLLRTNAGAKVICHADLHPANLIRTSSDEVFVIDWDDVMLAPKERDFLFVRQGKGTGEIPPFFEGYGAMEIDWVALTYYHCERVVQDLFANAQEVFFRDDLGEEAKAFTVKPEFRQAITLY